MRCIVPMEAHKLRFQRRRCPHFSLLLRIRKQWRNALHSRLNLPFVGCRMRKLLDAHRARLSAACSLLTPTLPLPHPHSRASAPTVLPPFIRFIISVIIIRTFSVLFQLVQVCFLCSQSAVARDKLRRALHAMHTFATQPPTTTIAEIIEFRLLHLRERAPNMCLAHRWQVLTGSPSIV